MHHMAPMEEHSPRQRETPYFYFTIQTNYRAHTSVSSAPRASDNPYPILLKYVEHVEYVNEPHDGAVIEALECP